MKHIALDAEDERVKQFVLSLPLDTEGAILELKGRSILRVVPCDDGGTIDRAQVKAAILTRRDASRALNAEWQDVDREGWERIPD